VDWFEHLLYQQVVRQHRSMVSRQRSKDRRQKNALWRYLRYFVLMNPIPFIENTVGNN